MSAGTQLNQSATTPILQIPTGTESWSCFYDRLTSLLSGADTHAYIDASFLMWLTKVGSTSRQELIDWFQRALPNRVHVPIWAAHEYVKHHVKQTVVENFRKRHGEISAIARRTYSDFRPFFDDPLGEDGEDPAAFRASVRATLNRLKQLLHTANQWPQQYEKHSAHVLEFINSAAPSSTSLYSDLSAIAEHADVRLSSSVPPGFKDLRKAHRAAPHEGTVSQRSDTNQYGDLIFWTEILSHAREVGANGVLVVTNDVKNDWLFGGSPNTANTNPELRKIRSSWKPIPRPHPMLLVEARSKADIKDVELIDSVYLGLYLQHTADPDVVKFADVALVPDVTTKDTPSRDQAAASGLDAEATDSATPDILFDDPDYVKSTRPKLTRALHLSREILDEQSAEILAKWAADSSSRSTLEQIFGPDAVEGMDHRRLAGIARTLHDDALIGKPGYADALTDALSVLPLLPNNTAASLYLGFLASMYLSRKRNEALLPPHSPNAEQIFELQRQEFAVNPIGVLSRHLLDCAFRPIYIPASEPPPVLLSLDTHPSGSSASQLANIRVSHGHPPTPFVELLTPAQADSSLRLATLFGDDFPVHGQAVVEKVCELFALPAAQVPDHPSIHSEYTITENLGFRTPKTVRVLKEQSNGD